MLFLSFALIVVSQTEHDLLPLLNFQSTLNISWILLCSWNSPVKNTGVDSHSLLQGIFPTQGSNPGLPHCRQSLYHLSYQGSPVFITFYLKVKYWYILSINLCCFHSIYHKFLNIAVITTFKGIFGYYDAQLPK